MSQVFTITQFAAQIKAKFPDYADIPDDDLVQKILIKYPQYKDHVSTVSNRSKVISGGSSTAPPPTSVDQELSARFPGYKRDEDMAGATARTGRAARRLAPVAGGAALALAGGPPGWLAGAGLATLGGAGGEAIGQLAERAVTGEGPATPQEAATQIGKEGAIQGAAEVGGRLLYGGFQLAKSALRPPPGASKLSSLSQELGLPARSEGAKKLLTESTVAGRYIGTKAGKEGLGKAAKSLEEPARTLGVAPPPAEIDAIKAFPVLAERTAKARATETAAAKAAETGPAREMALSNAKDEIDVALAQLGSTGATKELTGQTIQQGITGGKSVAMRKAEELYKAADDANVDALIDISGLKPALRQARRELAANPALRDSTLVKVIDKVLGKAPKAGAKKAKPGALKKPLGLPDQINYQQARALQKALGQSFESTQGQLISKEVKGLGKKLWGEWTDAMEASLAKSPGVSGPPTLEAAVAAAERSVSEIPEGLATAAAAAPKAAPGTIRLYRGEGELSTRGGNWFDPDLAQAHGYASTSGGSISYVDVPKAAYKSLAPHGGEVQLPAELAANASHLAPVEATAMSPGLDALQAANAHYRQVSGIYKRGQVPKIAKAFPEKVIALIPDGGATPAKALREAVLGQVEKHGSDVEKAAAQKAWDTLGETFARERLMKGGAAKITANFEKVGPEVIKELYGSSPTGRQAIATLRNIGRRVDAMAPALAKSAGLSAEQLAALAKAQDVAAVVRQSQVAGHAGTQGGIGGVPYRFAIIDLLLFKFVKGAGAAEVAAEGAGGLISWAMYRPAKAAKLMDALSGIAQQSPRAAVALSRIFDEYQKDQPPGGPPE